LENPNSDAHMLKTFAFTRLGWAGSAPHSENQDPNSISAGCRQNRLGICNGLSVASSLTGHQEHDRCPGAVDLQHILAGINNARAVQTLDPWDLAGLVGVDRPEKGDLKPDR